jgi:2-haloacid dehalogenase
MRDDSAKRGFATTETIGSDRRSLLFAAGLSAVGMLAPFAGHAMRMSTFPVSARNTVLVFDVADTLLNIQALAPLFARVFGDGKVADEWFGQSILYAETATATGQYIPFGSISQGVFRMLGKIHGAVVKPTDVDELEQRIKTLPPHTDVPKGLDLLKQAGFRMVTLTNTAASGPDGPLQKAGLGKYFERHFSAEAVSRFKPALESYRMVAKQLGLATGNLCMVAAHPWDLIGAQTAGCSAALIARRDVALFRIQSSVPTPDLIGHDLVDLVGSITALSSTRTRGENSSPDSGEPGV